MTHTYRAADRHPFAEKNPKPENRRKRCP